MREFIKGANPYMPLWEHVPDGEPRVFEHNGEKRVYVYGSHDTEIKHYCGRDYVVWSAPVDDLTDWTYHGVAYKTHYDSVLYAPDVVKKGDTYYMYAAERAVSLVLWPALRHLGDLLRILWRPSLVLIRGCLLMMTEGYTLIGVAVRRRAISWN